MKPGGWRDALRLRLRALFRGRRVDHDLDEELQFHLERQIEEHVGRGVDREHARTLALRQLGSLDSQREQCRDARGVNHLDHLLRDTRGAARLLIRSPGFTTVAVLSLALGIGANATIFQLLDSVRLRSLPVAEASRLVRINIANGVVVPDNYSGRYASATYPLWEQVAAHHEPFTGLLAWSHSTMDLSNGGESRFVENGLSVSGGFFDVLGVAPAAGRLFTAADDTPACDRRGVVLSHAFWQHNYGGANSAVGATLSLNGAPFTVIGVTARSFYGVEVGRSFDLAVPLCADPLINQDSSRLTSRSSWWLGIMGRLKPDWTVDRASAYVAAASPHIFEDTLPPEFSTENAKLYRGFRLAATPGRSGFSELRDRYDASLWLLLGIAGIVLLIACANLANLLLARMSAREREMAVRLALGASRGRLIQQLLIESVLLAAVGTAAGAWFAPALGRAIVGLISSDVNPMFVDLSLDWRVFGFLASLAILTTLLFGLAPALGAARVPPGSVMKGGGRGVIGSRSSLVLRRLLVAAQVALSVVLVVAGLLFARSLFNLLTVDAGFAPAGLLQTDVDMRPLSLQGPARAALRDDLIRRLRELPDVSNVATVASVPLVANWWRNVYLSTGDGPKRVMGRFNRVSAGYFDTVSTRFIAGRDFDPAIDSPTSPRVAIVNQTFVQQNLGGQPPLGLEFRPEGTQGGEPGPTTFRIVGVVGDTKHGTLREPFAPIVYVAEQQVGEPSQFLSVFIRPRANGPGIMPAVRNTVAQTSSRIAFHFHDVGQVRLESIAQDRLMAVLCGAFAAVGRLLAMIGVYGVMAYSLTRRRSEIGVRMALGADRGAIVRMAIGEGARLVTLGVIAGTVISVAVSRVAGRQLYGLEPTDPGTFMLAIAALFVVAMAAVYFPANRASRTEPTVALRHD